MKLIASLLAAAVLSAANVAAHADTIAPGVSLGLASGTTNYSFTQVVPGTLTFSDGLESITAVYANTGLLNTVALTEVCLSTGIGTAPCKAYTLTVGDVNALGGVGWCGGQPCPAGEHDVGHDDGDDQDLDQHRHHGRDSGLCCACDLQPRSRAGQPWPDGDGTGWGGGGRCARSSGHNVLASRSRAQVPREEPAPCFAFGREASKRGRTKA